MNILVFYLFTALYTHSVYGSHYHGPLAHPVVLHNGYLADTHEVAAAKDAHLSTLGNSHGHTDVSHNDNGHLRYHGPTAIPHVLHDGHIADTHEVAAAKAEHYAAVAKAQTHGGYGHDYNHGSSNEHSHHNHGHLRYHGPTAIPHVLHDGHIADTHEVAAAKAEHYAAVAKAQTHGGYGHDYNHGSSNEHSHHNHGHLRYHGPTAVPHVLHDGHIADTHEVAAAKAEHFAAVAKAKAHDTYSHDYHGHGNRYARHVVPYHGPLAKPIVLHNGYLADTHEVAAAKSAHLSTLAYQSHGYSHGHFDSHDDHGHLRYHGSTSIPHVLHDGHIADTHEVAVAKAEHFAAIAKAQAHGGYGHDYYNHGEKSYEHGRSYHGPLAKPVVLHNGYLADTHEVAAAKNHHLQALHSAHH